MSSSPASLESDSPSRYRALVIAGIGLLAVAIAALCAGRYALTPAQAWQGLIARLPLLSPIWSSHAAALPAPLAQWQAIVVDARLPRVVAAALAGAALSVGGTACQAAFRNTLVSPGWLGVLSGAALGAALGILTGGASPAAPWIQGCAFLGGGAAMALAVVIARVLGGGGTLALLLGGLVSNALFTALLSLVKYAADPLDQLPAIVYWLLGSLAQVGWPDLARLAPLLALGTALLCAAAPLFDALALDDDEARSLGVPVRAIRLGIVALATLVTALSVALGGMIGWVGLLVPHLARALVGASHRVVVPLSALIGASVLIVADTLARSVALAEIPLGVITEIAGALAFAIVLVRLRGRFAR